jgi:hypothetical protein
MNFAAEHDLRYLSLLDAANASTKVGSLTHSFYRYPARFGETFVREAVRNFSNEGEVVLDPFCGGGTTLVEALTAGRFAIGSDVSQLAIAVTRAKTSPVSAQQLVTVSDWVQATTASTKDLLSAHRHADDPRLTNVPGAARHLIASLRDRVGLLPRGACQDFATCLLLRAVQWAYDGKELLPRPSAIVARVRTSFEEMREGMVQFGRAIEKTGVRAYDIRRRRFLNVGAADSLSSSLFGFDRPSVSLVVTSPPYLGVHVLYNRWQLQGRKELKVPFFIADCEDIGGPASYTIIGRASRSTDQYFARIRSSFLAIGHMLKSQAYVIQLVSFANADASLPLYLLAMRGAGLEPCEAYMRMAGEFTWRPVPGRRWYARVGAMVDSSAAREVLLVHRKGK